MYAANNSILKVLDLDKDMSLNWSCARNNSFETNGCIGSANLGDPWLLIFLFLDIVSGCIAVCGNSVILFVFYKHRPLMKNRSNYFVASLAAADLYVGLFIDPLYIALTCSQLWFEDHPLMEVENVAWLHSLTTTAFNLCAITFDRYISITMPLRYGQIITPSRRRKMIALVWILPVLIALSTFLFKDHLPILWLFCSGITVLPSLLVITLCYCRIYREAKRQAKNIRHYSNRNSKEVVDSLRNTKAAGTFAIIVGLFVLLYLPSFVFSFLEIAGFDLCTKRKLHRHWLWAILVNFSSSACNPWIYGIRSRELRQALKVLLGYKKTKTRSDVVRNTEQHE